MVEVPDKAVKMRLMNENYALKKHIFGMNKVFKKDTKERLENVIIA